MSYSIDLIEEVISAERIGNESFTIKWLLTDSRSLCFPEETLFFALVTTRNSGASYIENLYERGVRNFVISLQEKELIERIRKNGIFPQSNFLLVESPLSALQQLAEKHREQFNVPVIGITGSNGKTVVKEWIYHLLSPAKAVVRSPRSYNSQIGVPLSIWQMDEQSEVVILEAGISQMGEMEALHNMIKPTIGVLTNIGGAHQKNFSSLQEKCLEKLTLFKDCDVIIYNGDDELIKDCVARSMLSTREIAWSRKDSEKPLYISQVIQKNDHTEIKYSYLGLKHSFTIPFVDDASIENALHSLAVALYLIVSPEQIEQRMTELEPVAMRLEVKKGKNDTFIINDSYNSDLASLDIALDFLYRRSQKQGLKRTLILSDILDSGQNTSALYQRVAQLIKNRNIDRVIGVGPMISSSEARFTQDKEFYPDTATLLNAIEKKEISFQQEAILIKGARQFQFDLISDLLEEQVHETILEVDLKAMIDNLNHYRSMTTRSTKVIGMIKASAYGSGSYEVAKTLQEHQVDYLAVAVADEGYELRKGGITVPIIVMNPEFSSFKTLFNYNLEPEVYSFHLLESLVKAAKKEGITKFPIHIKIDTGMHRLGFDPSEILQLVEFLKTQDAVIPRSVFSHLVGSDSAVFDDFTHRQIALFNESAKILQDAFDHKILKHICNSAGIERFPEAHFDMVRLGIGLYGINTIDNSIINNVNTLKTTILQIRKVDANETVGYSRKGVMVRTSRVAAIPIGYADGISRGLSNGVGYCLVNGEKAPYVGNICMDVCMIDVTDIDCKEGDEVIVFGKELPITVLSDILHTIPYEILSNVSKRVKRVYFQE